MVGMPRGRNFPLALGIKTLRNGRGLYPRRFNLPTASHRLSGVSHSSRSTPAVRAPWFCVTRRTAYNFADNVRVNILCRAFTLRQSLSRVAFAIRICIPLTFRSTRRQSTSCQRFGAWESADPSFRTDTFMLLSYLGVISPPAETQLPQWGRYAPLGNHSRSRYGHVRPYFELVLAKRAHVPALLQVKRSVSRLATVDQTEVCPLSRGMMFQSLFEPLQPDIRFFRPPIPAPLTASLTVRLPTLPRWQRYGLTAFPACHTADLGSASPPTV